MAHIIRSNFAHLVGDQQTTKQLHRTVGCELTGLKVLSAPEWFAPVPCHAPIDDPKSLSCLGLQSAILSDFPAMVGVHGRARSFHLASAGVPRSDEVRAEVAGYPPRGLRAVHCSGC